MRDGWVSWGAFSAFLLVAATVPAAACRSADVAANGETRAECLPLDHEHRSWTTLLGKYTQNGFVEYGKMKGGAARTLDAYLASLEAVCGTDYASWSEPERLAYWINAYNAYTIKLILDHYPLKSIRSIGFLPGSAFRRDFIPLQLRPSPLSLDDIEHEILRKQFREPRIHFAIVCASTSCPALRSEAFVARDLDRQLDEAARAFIRDPRRNRVDATTGRLQLSSIFNWFREDFERGGGSLAGFAARYADETMTAAIRARDGKPDIEFLDYDWSLNGR
jgi:hypothetical protein